MSIQSHEELLNTKKKLQELEAHYERRKKEPAANPQLRQLSLQSLKSLMNQLTEEIVRYEAHHKVSR